MFIHCIYTATEPYITQVHCAAFYPQRDGKSFGLMEINRKDICSLSTKHLQWSLMVYSSAPRAIAHAGAILYHQPRVSTNRCVVIMTTLQRVVRCKQVMPCTANLVQRPITWCCHLAHYPSMCTLKPLSNGPLYINTVIGTLAVDGWVVTLGTARRGLSGLRPRPDPSSLYQRPVYQLYIIRCGTNCLCILKG